VGCSSLLLWLARSPDVPLHVGSPGERAAAMKSVRINDLRFYDLAGSAVPLTDYFQDYALVIFLRHLA
jgi:hypothetical protein